MSRRVAVSKTSGGITSTSGLRIRLIERVFAVGN